FPRTLLKETTMRTHLRSGLLLACTAFLAAPTHAQEEPRGDRPGLRGERGDRNQRGQRGRGAEGRRGGQAEGGQRGEARGNSRDRGAGGMFGGLPRWSTEPDFLRRDLRLVDDMLLVADEQLPMVEAFLADYEEGFQKAREEIQAKLRELRDANRPPEPSAEEQEEMRAMRMMMSGNRELVDAEAAELEELRSEIEAMRAKFQEMRMERMPEQDQIAEIARQASALRKEWLRNRASLEAEFTESLQVILSEEQLTLWDPFRRQVRRDRALPRGVLSGESLDVNTVVREFDASEAAAEALLAWEVELDKTLIDRDKTMMEIDLDALVATLENDDKAARDAARSESKVSRDVRDANLEAIDSIAALLGEQGDEFRLAAWKRAFPRVYRQTSFERALDAVRKIEGLDPLVLETVDRLEADFLTQLSELHEEAREATLKQELKQFEDRFNQMRDRMNGERQRSDREPTELDEIRERLRELEADSRETLEGMLNPEEIAQLPRAGDRRGGPRNDEQRGDMRQRIIERFDRNGDGELDASERENAMREMRNRRGNPERGIPGE
ncbi:MAG: hypothetical protein VXX19_05625, partial [Planctomycetota bacterium]|nr:hypothetical protein [Planctomycetota bacterium]